VPIASNAAGHLLTLEAGVTRESTPAREAIEGALRGSVSLDSNENSRDAFETIARTAGLNVIFDRDFHGVTMPFKFENVSILDALDLLALQTRSFWEVLDSKTIFIAPDNQSKRRDFETQVVKTFYVQNAS